VTPADGATGVGANTAVTATFSRNMNSASITPSTFTLSSPSGSVAGTVTYVAATNKATFTPNARLQDGVTYTARLITGITAADGMPLGSARTWQFTTATAVVAPTVTATAPTAGATGVPRDVTVSATFSKDMDPSTITATTFTLVAPDGTVLPADVTYTAGNRTASLNTAAPLSTSTAYTARLSTGIKAADGTSLASAVSWGFTSNASACPCSLFPSTVTPALTNLSTQDGRPGPGPWSYELGMNFNVDQAANLTAIRFYKATQETGIHTGTIWSSSGQALATVIFTNETASGWQNQKLSSPLPLQANTTYVVSINANAFYNVTQDVFTVAIDNGPLHGLAGPGNGVFGNSAGIFPTGSYRSSNYFVDVVVSDPS